MADIVARIHREQCVVLRFTLFASVPEAVTMVGVSERAAKTREVKTKAADGAVRANPHMTRLRSVVSQAPECPGVYRWLNEKGEVLYVGKAKNLRSRLKSYVLKTDSSLGPWKLALIGKIADVDMTVTATEVEALILEMQIVKELKPKYNVLLKDDKNYVYVRVSMGDRYPDVTTVRRMDQDGAKYFGPYLSSYATKLTLDTLQEILDFRVCKNGLARLNRLREPEIDKACLDSQIGKCNGACSGRISAQEHGSRIDALLKFYAGDRDAVRATLREKMAAAAADRKFEKAAKLRDSLKHIDSLDEKQIVSDTSGENIDVIGIALHTGKAHIVLLRERNGKLVGDQSFSLAGQADTPGSVAEQFIPQFYAASEDIPDVIVLPESCEQSDVLEAWLTQLRGRKTEIVVPERGKKSALLNMAQANANQKILQELSSWEAAARNVEHALDELRTVLKLPGLPKRIEGYDISHLGGTETVASMTVIRNGKPANDQYRSFTLRTLKEGEVDDYKSLNEALRRRLLHLVRNVKREESLWKDRSVTFGKPKKAESESLDALCTRRFGCAASALSSCMVARSEGSIVACAALRTHDGGVKEAVLARSDEGASLEDREMFAMRKLLAALKKGKVYVRIPSEAYDSFADIGFRHVLELPKAFVDLSEKEIVMSYDAAENKPDVSLSAVPDLLVIDGGKGQLGAVTAVLRALDLSIPVIGLAKREEEVFLPGDSFPVAFAKDSQAKFLLMRLRDEAHRFANRHREKRGKAKAVHSALDDIPGFGDKTKKLLLKEFGSVAGIRKATDEDLKIHLSSAQIESLRRHL